MAADAKRMPAREAEYRNLVLNQRIETTNPFIAPAVWSACGGPVGSLEGMQLYGGLDLISHHRLDRARADRVARWQVAGGPTFWLPSEGLSDKAIADRVPYDLWHGQGHLQATPGKTVSPTNSSPGTCAICSSAMISARSGSIVGT